VYRQTTLERIRPAEVQLDIVTDVQPYLSIGIPTFAVLIGILTNVIHHSAVNSRFNSVDARFSSMDARFNSLDARMNNLEGKFDILTGKVIDIDNRVTRIEAKLDMG
jgi:hypothetical protein